MIKIMKPIKCTAGLHRELLRLEMAWEWMTDLFRPRVNFKAGAKGKYGEDTPGSTSININVRICFWY